MLIRLEQEADRQQIRIINTSAFETDAEANLVEALRQSDIPLISLVAEEENQLIGHILFSPVSLAGQAHTPAIAGLAPMAVLPEWQGKGVGNRLVREGLKYCAEAGYDAVVVLGHPDYYPRFGFVPASTFNIKSEYEVPDEAFMLKELKESALTGIRGVVQYHETFNQL
ncbi:MAG: N-acetyltransferase [Gammaproteobacteria bacterium]|nr:N-acetyltransferase [Gammaproteobacteria bacterium]